MGLSSARSTRGPDAATRGGAAADGPSGPPMGRAGATVWGYFPADQGHASAEQLLEAGASCVFGDMGELPAMLRAIGQASASA
mgnify:CR=1 FL=1